LQVKPEKACDQTMMKHLLLFSFLGLCLPSAAAGKPYNLDELLELAKKGNPGLAAGASATAGVEAQLLEAKRSWMPTGELSSLVAPTMEIRCMGANDTEINPDKAYRESNCTKTSFTYTKSNWADAITNLQGVFSRTEIKLVQPVYTFGKISAGVAAAESGVKASQSRQSGQLADLELNVRKAYWGAKLAHEILTTLNEGSGFLDDAQKKIDKDLAEGTGDTSVTDRLRLRTIRAEIDARILEAKRGADVACGGLRALIGPDAPADLATDDTPLEALAVASHTLDDYRDAAKQSRPELKALLHLAAAKRALADFEWRKQFPDFVLIGTAQYAYASAIDTPRNAFANNPFNTTGAGIAAAVRMPLDLGVKNAHAIRSRAEAEEVEQRRREASSGILFEVEKAHIEMKEAEERMKVMQKGEKAGRQWIAAIAQNLAVGLSETKDFSDALLAFFQARIRYLQATYDYNIATAALTRATGMDVTRSATQ
jgi:outer membrane protein